MADIKQKTKNKQWFAVYTRSRYEKRVVTELQELGFEAWLPLIKTLRQWSDRKKMVEVPLFRSYVFVRADIAQIKFILYPIVGAVYIVSFSGEPSVVPDKQIEGLKLLLGSTEKFEISTERFNVGEPIEVTMGPLKGMQGVFVDKKGSKRIMMRIDAINQSLLIDINPAYVKKIQAGEKSLA
jgi:transcription antitermination factor NusG